MLNLLLCVDSNYLDKACTMLFSLRLHTKEVATVYLMNHSLENNEIEEFRTYLHKKCKMGLEIVDVRGTALDEYPITSSHYKVEMYYRILAQFLLPDTLERVLWLDADIVLLKDIAPFYHQDFENKMLVACPDCNNGTPVVEKCLKQLELPLDHEYFNSGVLLMNLPLLREHTAMEGILKQCERLRDKLTFPDQDILNTIYAGQVKYAPWKQYNYQVGLMKRIPKEDVRRIVVLHYTSYVKPWMYWYISNCSRYYWKVRFKQGHRVATMRAYRQKIWDILGPSLRELKGLFF